MTIADVKNAEALSAVRFQERDAKLLEAILEYDGVLARRHVKYLFWPKKTWRAMEKRLSKLHEEHYLAWPSLEDRKLHAVPEPILWLGWRGAWYLVGRQGHEVDPPPGINENQLRLFERRLRDVGFAWCREPHWIQLKHDLNVVDARFWVNASLQGHPYLSLEAWVNESVFRSDLDFVDYGLRTREGEIVSRRKGVRPDGFFTLLDERRRQQGEPFRARFLVEVDMATHDNPSFGIEKAAPGLAYIRSPAYLARFGGNSGRWLVITTGETRLRNLLYQIQERIPEDTSLFFFTTFESMRGNNFFSSPIWWQVGLDVPRPLLA